MILDCKPIAAAVLARLTERGTPQTSLAAVLIGNDPASVSFLEQKKRTAQKLGIQFDIHQFPESTTQEMVLEAIGALGHDAQVGGIILQLPLPEGFIRDELVAQIPLNKDVDVLRGEGKLLSPAVGTLIEILQQINFDIQNASVVVVGRGFLIGAPITAWLQNKAKEVVVMGRDSFDVEKIRTADVVISGTGKAGLITGEQIKSGAVCIDFGYAKKDGVLQGDFDAASVGAKAAYLTPTPGGTGPLLVAKLFENFFALAANL